MTLYNNGNSLPQGRHGSPLLTLLQTWSNVRPGTRQLSEDDERILAAQGMPDFYMSYLQKYVEINAIDYFGTIMYYIDKLDLLITKQFDK